MSRLYALLLAVIAGSALLGMAIAEHPGYVLFAYKGYRFESSLWVFLGLLMVLGVAFFVLRWLIGLLAASARWPNSRKHANCSPSRSLLFSKTSRKDWAFSTAIT